MNTPVGSNSNGITIMGTLQIVQLGVTIALAILGFFLQAKTQEISERAQESKVALEAVEREVRLRQEDRASQSARDDLRVTLFDKVAQSLEKQDARQQTIAKALVIAMLPDNDQLRLGLTAALAAEGVPEVQQQAKKVVDAENRFASEQVAIANTIQQASPSPATSDANLKAYYIDVFYCENTGDRSAAEQVKATLEQRGAVRSVRLRALPQSINASPGYRVAGWEVRHDTDETAVAQSLVELLNSAGMKNFSPKLVRTPTRWYMSVFTC